MKSDDTPKEQERENLITLREIIANRFDIGELRTLCFDLGVDYDDLPADGKANKARELVAYLARRNDIPRLVQFVRRQRSDISWSDILDMTKKVSDGDDKTRLEAAQGLAVLKDHSTIPILAHRLEVEPDPTIRYWLAYALGQIGGKEACAVLHQANTQERDVWAKEGITKGLQIAGCETPK